MKISSSSDRVKSQSSTGYSYENNKRMVMKHIKLRKDSLLVKENL